MHKAFVHLPNIFFLHANAHFFLIKDLHIFIWFLSDNMMRSEQPGPEKLTLLLQKKTLISWDYFWNLRKQVALKNVSNVWPKLKYI